MLHHYAKRLLTCRRLVYCVDELLEDGLVGVNSLRRHIVHHAEVALLSSFNDSLGSLFVHRCPRYLTKGVLHKREERASHQVFTDLELVSHQVVDLTTCEVSQLHLRNFVGKLLVLSYSNRDGFYGGSFNGGGLGYNLRLHLIHQLHSRLLKPCLSLGVSALKTKLELRVCVFTEQGFKVLYLLVKSLLLLLCP